MVSAPLRCARSDSNRQHLVSKTSLSAHWSTSARIVPTLLAGPIGAGEGPLRTSAATAPAPCTGDRMAVGAQEPQIRAPVVAPVAVDMVDLQRHGPPVPFGRRSALVAPFGHARLKEGSAQQGGLGAPSTVVLHEYVDRPLTRIRPGLSTLVSLPQEVRGVEAEFRDPCTEVPADRGSVGQPESP